MELELSRVNKCSKGRGRRVHGWFWVGTCERMMGEREQVETWHFIGAVICVVHFSSWGTGVCWPSARNVIPQKRMDA
eukprot:1159467-Pelagomonas_calceolata.AAC.4